MSRQPVFGAEEIHTDGARIGSENETEDSGAALTAFDNHSNID